MQKINNEAKLLSDLTSKSQSGGAGSHGEAFPKEKCVPRSFFRMGVMFATMVKVTLDGDQSPFCAHIRKGCWYRPVERASCAHLTMHTGGLGQQYPHCVAQILNFIFLLLLV